MNDSDKWFWHHYIPFYESFFKDRTFSSIAEIGIFKGDSVRWLLNRFPSATVLGGDILPQQESWPTDARFRFEQIDQGNTEDLLRFFAANQFDLVIEDGSHYPQHQINSILIGLPSVKSNGIYIVEDIHSSHISHPLNLQPETGNLLSVLLAIQHYKNINAELTVERAEIVALNSLLTTEQVLALNNNIKELHLYRRHKLPDKCYSCGSIDYFFSAYQCACGMKIFEDNDSMSFLIIKK